MEKHRFLNAAYKLLLNRFYINAFYYKVAYFARFLSQKIHDGLEHGLNALNDLIASRFLSFARMTHKYVEMEGITKSPISGFSSFFDVITGRVVSLSQWAYLHLELGGFEAFNHKFARVVTYFSGKIRKIQTGVLSYNILAILAGLMLMVMLIMKFGGIF